jgi:hypothetical protein
MWNAERQLESIQKLINSVPASKVMPAPLPASLPSIKTTFPAAQSFKIAAPTRTLSRQPTGDVVASNASSVSSGMTAVQWIERVKGTLNRADYLLLKRHLRRLLEGAHGQCEITVNEALVTLRDLLEKADMVDTFETVIAGTNANLKARWYEALSSRK